MNGIKITGYGLVLILTGIIIGFVVSSGFDFSQKMNAEVAQSSTETQVTTQQSTAIADLEALSSAFADVAEKVNPSVVTISTKTVIKGQQMPQMTPFEEFFGDDFFRRFFQGPIPQQDYIQQGLGSGVIVSEDGILITNNHVVKDVDDIIIRLENNSEYTAEVKGIDELTDLAILKIDAKNLPYLKMGDSDKLRVGEWVLAVGSPLQPELAHTVTSGIVSGKGRSGLSLSPYQDYIQTDAAINPGNSGGPLVNLRGQLVGINTAIASRTGGNMGIGFAIPSKLVEKVMNDILKKGKVVRGWLGVGIQNITPELANNFGLDRTAGVIITQVTKDSPAEDAGLKDSDIILALNGQEIENVVQLSTKIGSTEPSTKVNLKILRNQQEKTVSVVLSEYPANEQVAPRPEKKSFERLGFQLADITPALQKRYQLDDNEGVIVTNVERGSGSHRAGLREGDVILKVNRVSVKNSSDFYEVLNSVGGGESVALYLKREDRKLFVAFNIPQNN
jgi:serine protease Do